MKVARLMEQTGGYDDPVRYALPISRPAKPDKKSKFKPIRIKPLYYHSKSGELHLANAPHLLQTFPRVSEQEGVYERAEITLDDGRKYNVSVLGRHREDLVARAGNNREMRFNVWKIKEYSVAA